MTTRVKLDVYVDLDDFPGPFHSVESARNAVANILAGRIPHYHPSVSTTNYRWEYDKKQAEARIDRSGTVSGRFFLVTPPVEETDK